MFICWGACIDEIKIDLPEARLQQKVVEGYVERDQNKYILWGQVSLTQNATGSFAPEPIGALITIRYNGNIDISIPEGTITRIPIDEFHRLYGGTPDEARFQLIAEVQGQRYHSAEQKIIPVPKPDSLTVKTELRTEVNMNNNITENRYVKLLVHTPLLNTKNELVSLSWVVSSAFQFMEGMRSNPFYDEKTCYSIYNVYQNDINVAGVQDYPGKRTIHNIEIAETPNDFRFSIACYFTVVQKSLNQESIDYWKEVKASNERTGNLYDVFPGRIRTNIINEIDEEEIVNGFFHASEVDTIRLRVNPDMVDYPRQRCLLWMEPEIITADDPDPCLDCLKLANSSLEPPHYWK